MDDFEEKLNSILSSPETMSQIMSLADSLSGGGSGQSTEETEQAETFAPSEGEGNPFAMLQTIDPVLLQRAMGLFRTYNGGNNEKVALLQSLRPFIREKNRSKLERAIQVARYSRVIGALLEEFRGGRHV